MNEIDNVYLNLCSMLLDDDYSTEIGNTREINNAIITLNDITQNIVSVRNISHSYLFAEWIWYLKGNNKVSFISPFASKWKNISDDGFTNNSAYGYLMLYKNGFNQIDKIIQLLDEDPNSRRAVINLNVPNENVITTKDEPCTIALQFLIRNGKLNCTTMMRSNDIWYGFPYDVAFFTLLQRIIADELNIGYGIYTHFATSLHVYDNNFKDLKKIISENDPSTKEFVYDHEKFMDNLDFVYELLNYSTVHCEPDFNKKYILMLAKEFFGYKS